MRAARSSVVIAVAVVWCLGRVGERAREGGEGWERCRRLPRRFGESGVPSHKDGRSAAWRA